MKQLDLEQRYIMEPTQKTSINVVRYTLRLPLELSIKMDMAMADQDTLNKNRWIIKAIEEKLARGETSNDSWKAVQQQIDELKRIMLEK